jgi:cytochrome c oxidase subunit IV
MTIEHTTEALHDEEEHHGLSDKGYVGIALLLAAITAAEVSLTYLDVGAFFMPALLIMMVAKFVIVVSFFMHLRFDNKIFTWLFYTGLLLAVGVYAAALFTFQFFAST